MQFAGEEAPSVNGRVTRSPDVMKNSPAYHAARFFGIRPEPLVGGSLRYVKRALAARRLGRPDHDGFEGSVERGWDSIAPWIECRCLCEGSPEDYAENWSAGQGRGDS